MWKWLIRWGKTISGRRGSAALPRRAQPVTAGELEGRFAAAPDNPLWEATLAVLAEKINALGTDAANPKLTDREILWRVAGVDALMGFLEELQDREARAREDRKD